MAAKKNQNRPTSMRLPPELSQDIKDLAEREDRSENAQMISMLKRQAQQEKEKGVSMNTHPCIISVDLPDEGREKRLAHLRSMFAWIQVGEQAETHSPEALCAGPKGLSYDEAFILLQKKYYDVGWVYADAVSRLPQNVEVAKNW